jgi:hypothetical protein
MDFIAMARAAADRAAARRSDVLGVSVAPDEIRAHLRARFDFSRPTPIDALVTGVDELLARWTEHATHPLHLGPFRPAPDPPRGRRAGAARRITSYETTCDDIDTLVAALGAALSGCGWPVRG